MNKNRWITTLFILLMTVFAVHILYVNTDGVRGDFTSGGLYTLTDGTQQILEKMHDDGVQPIDIKLYFSHTTGKTLPQFIKNFITYKGYVHNLLREYERASNGKISLNVIDPKTDSDEAQDASDYGLTGHQINQHGDQFFFGLVFETQTGSKDIIEFLWPEKQESIEYEISKRIHTLLWPSKQRIGVLSSLDVTGGDDDPYYRQLLAAQGKQPADPWTSFQLLDESYEVKTIGLDVDHISKDEYDLVVVVHPKNLAEKSLWALDEWVTTGGNTLVFVDPYSLMDRAPANPQQPMAQYQYDPSSSLEKLFNAWGLSMPANQIAADYTLAVKRPYAQNSPAEKILVDLNVTEDTRDVAFDQDAPMLNGLTNVRFFMAGVLEEQGEVDWTRQPLIRTTDQSTTLEMFPGFPTDGKLTFLDINQPAKLLNQFSPEGKSHVLAYLISGKLATAFPDGARFPEKAPETPPGMPPGFQMPPDENATFIEKEATPEDQRAEATVMVFADSDFISDQLAFQNSFFGKAAVGDNAKVLLNAVDYLLGSKELMNVRSKKNLRRPFKLFDAIEAKADLETLDKEKEFRANVEKFQKEYQEKSRQLNQKNAALLEKKVKDELAALQAKKSEAEKNLREIRKTKRAQLESEETFVRISAMGFMPLVMLILGLTLFFRRKMSIYRTQGGKQ